MATEINGTTAQAQVGWRRFGSFKSSGGNLYAIGATTLTGTNTLAVFKSSDGSSWTEQDSTNRPDVTDRATWFIDPTFKYLDAEQDGDTIHIAVGGANTAQSHVVFYASFDMSSDGWNQVSGTDYEYLIDYIENNDSDADPNPYVQINVRSDGDVIVFYNGTKTASKGTDYTRVYYARLESGTWTSGVAVGGVTNANEVVRSATIDASDISYLIYDQTSRSYKKLTSANALDSTPTASNWGNALNVHPPACIGINRGATPALVVGNNSGSTQTAVGEYNSSSTIYEATGLSSTATSPGVAWDSTNSLLRIVYGQTSTFDRVHVAYDPSDHSFTEVEDLATGADHANVRYSLLVDGTTLRVLYTDADADIWYEEYDLGGATTVNVALTNTQAFAADVSIPVQVSSALTNGQSVVVNVATLAEVLVDTALTNSQAFAADVSIPVAIDVALTNTQTFAADVSIPVQVSSALTNTQAIAVDVSIPVQVSSALTNTQAFAADVQTIFPLDVSVALTNTQAFAADVSVPVTADIALVNTQAFAADVTVPRTVDVTLVNTQVFSADVNTIVPRIVSVALVNTQAFAADISVPVQLSSALVNTQAIAVDVSIPIQASGALVNTQAIDVNITATDTRYVNVALVNTQSMTTDIGVPRTLSVSLANAQSIDVDVGIPVQTTVVLANPSQVLAVDVSVPVGVSSSLVNSESIAVEVSIPVQVTVGLTNAEAFFANVGVLEGVSANLALVNSQSIVVDLGVKVSVDGNLVNQVQAFAADVGIVVGLEATLTNPQQIMAVDAGVLVQAAASLLASPQVLNIFVRMERAKTFVSTFTVRLFSSSVSLSTFTSSVTASQYSSHVDVDA